MDSDEVVQAGRLLEEINESLEVVLWEASRPGANRHRSYDKFVASIEQFQPTPQLLDSRIRGFLERVVRSYEAHNLFDRSAECDDPLIGKTFYQFAKVRGTKTVSNCLSSDISLIPHVMRKIEHDSTCCWETRFFLLVWLSVLILAPFPLVKLSPNLPDELCKLGVQYLGVGSKETDAAASLMARFLSRVDAGAYLEEFITANFNTMSWETATGFLKVGMLTTMNYLLKIVTVEQIGPHINRILTLTLNELQENPNSTMLKLFVKIAGKLSRFFLYKKDWASVESIVTVLLQFLAHNDTVIRYSVAKQLAKITQHIDPRSRQDILEALAGIIEVPVVANFTDLTIDADTIDIECYHGVLLALGELCRLRLMDKSGLSFTASLAHKTLFVEQHLLTHSVGSNVRDASCFDCWSTFKKYRTEEIPQTLMTTLFRDLMLVCCFDGDLMIRRAASATLQELVGRHGDLLFAGYPATDLLKVRLIETLDYTVLGHLDKSFRLPIQIYKDLDGLMYDQFVEHLLQHGITNFNSQLRKEAAKTLSALVSLSNEYDPANIIHGLYSVDSDGILYTIGELIPLLPENSVDIDFYHSLLGKKRFDFHKDSVDRGEEYLHILSRLVQHQSFEPNTHELDTVFNIIRAKKQEISAEFIALAKGLKQLPEEYQKKWLYYTKNGNSASAKALGYSPVLVSKPNGVVSLLQLKSVDATIRADIIDSISGYLQENSAKILQPFLSDLIMNLDDYTTTNEGDVGSFVRLATIRMIQLNEAFFSHAKESINCRLLRLSCELMDNVKMESIKLLRSLNRLDFDVQLHDYDTYFDRILSLYTTNFIGQRETSQEFWKGYSFSGGSPQAADEVVNGALHSFFRFWRAVSTEMQESVLTDIFSLLRKSASGTVDTRTWKMQTACLQFVCNLLELNLEIPDQFKLEVLFVRTYNLTLGSKNYQRLGIAVRIFTNLALRDSSRFDKCEKRLCWLAKNHPMVKVRTRANEGLQEVSFR